MRRNSSSQFPIPPSLQPLPSVRAKIWHIISLTFTIGGLALMGWGGWLFIQNQIEANKPPPARILEVNVEDLVETSTQPTLDTASGQMPVIISESATNGVPSLAGNPLPVVEAEEIARPDVRGAPQQEEKLGTAENTLESRSNQGVVPALGPVVEAVPSLADNPLPVTEAAETIEKAANLFVETGEATGPSPATSSPTRIVAESINLDAEVIEVGWEQVIQNGIPTNVWVVADYAAGWHQNSALPGQQGNVVLSGHHNIKGEVFRYLVDLEPGSTITLYADDRPYTYIVTDKFIVKDKGEPEAVRRENAKWIGPFNDQRLTLVTCWPYNNNTHRLIVIGHPVDDA